MFPSAMLVLLRVGTVAGSQALSFGAVVGFTLGLSSSLKRGLWHPFRRKGPDPSPSKWRQGGDALESVGGTMTVANRLSGLLVKVLSALGGVLRLDVSVVTLSGTLQSLHREASTPPPLRRRMLQLVVLGDSGVGKTKMVEQFVYGRSSFWTTPTRGADFHVRDVLCDDTLVTLQIWDVSGQDGVALGPHFFQGAAGCLLVHNSCSPSSLENLQAWLRAFESLSGAKHEEGFPTAVLIAENGQRSNGCYKEKIKGMNSLSWQGSSQILPVYHMTSPTDNQAAFDAFMYITQAALQRSAKISSHGGNGFMPFQTEQNVWAGWEE